jgi:hypothetical protein
MALAASQLAFSHYQVLSSQCKPRWRVGWADVTIEKELDIKLARVQYFKHMQGDPDEVMRIEFSASAIAVKFPDIVSDVKFDIDRLKPVHFVDSIVDN